MLNDGARENAGSKRQDTTAFSKSQYTSELSRIISL